MKHEHSSVRSWIPLFFSHEVAGLTYGLIILCATTAIAAEEEPSYDGRLLSEWLGDLIPGQMSGGASPTEKAVYAIGTNAIPTLLKWISYAPSASEPSSQIEWKLPLYRPITNLNLYPEERAARSASAFGYLGAVARPAIPELTRLARAAANPKRAERFTSALALTGPTALPSLVSLATNSPPWTRYNAISWLVRFVNDPAVAAPLVPMLMNCLCDTNLDTDYPVTGLAEEVLTDMTPEIVAPALTNALQSPSVFARQRAIACLKVFESRDPTNVPPTAVPALRAAMRDPDSVVSLVATSILRGMGGWEQVGDEWVRRHGTNTLNGITPDFFTNAPAR